MPCLPVLYPGEMHTKSTTWALSTRTAQRRQTHSRRLWNFSFVQSVILPHKTLAPRPYLRPWLHHLLSVSETDNPGDLVRPASGIEQPLSPWVWFLLSVKSSRSGRVPAGVRTPFLSLRLNHTPCVGRPCCVCPLSVSGFWSLTFQPPCTLHGQALSPASACWHAHQRRGGLSSLSKECCDVPHGGRPVQRSQQCRRAPVSPCPGQHLVSLGFWR